MLNNEQMFFLPSFSEIRCVLLEFCQTNAFLAEVIIPLAFVPAGKSYQYVAI